MNECLIALIRRLNVLLHETKSGEIDPVGFTAAKPVAIQYDTYTKLADHKRYQRYTFQHGLKLLVTITSNTHAVSEGTQELLSVLIDEDGDVYNPFFRVLSVDDYHLLHQALCMLISTFEDPSIWKTDTSQS